MPHSSASEDAINKFNMKAPAVITLVPELILSATYLRALFPFLLDCN